jgi:hypothetical protein
MESCLPIGWRTFLATIDYSKVPALITLDGSVGTVYNTSQLEVLGYGRAKTWPFIGAATKRWILQRLHHRTVFP